MLSAQETIAERYPEFFMGFQILESQQQAILDTIHKVDELQLGNMVILHPMDQNWSLTSNGRSNKRSRQPRALHYL